MRPTRLFPLAVLLTVSLTACTRAAIIAANLPASFGPYTRTTDMAYGSLDRQWLDIYVPDGPATAPRPVVVFFHGGGWSSGSKDQYRFLGSGLAEKGVITVVADYRLYPAVTFPAFMEDAARAVAWTVRNAGEFGGDPSRVFVMGHSAGAYMAILVTLDPRYLAEAGTDADLIRGAIGLSGPYDFELDSDLLLGIFGASSDVKLTQPVEFVRSDAPPLLLIHGTNDQVVRDKHSARLAKLVGEAGGIVELKAYSGLGHADTIAAISAVRRSRAPVLEDIAKFIAAAEQRPIKRRPRLARPSG